MGRLILRLSIVVLAALGGFWLYQTFIARGVGKYVAFWERRAFSQAEWDQSDPLDRFERYRMVHDLLDRHSFVGQTRQEVEDLLGLALYESGPGFEIYAGEEYGWDIDPVRFYTLAFEMDSTNKITGVMFKCSGSSC